MCRTVIAISQRIQSLIHVYILIPALYVSVPASPPVQTYSTISQLFNTVNVVFKLTMHEQKEALIIRINLEVRLCQIQ